MDSVLLEFPFEVDKCENKISIKTKKERKGNLVTFFLPFNLEIVVLDASVISVESIGDRYVFLLKFYTETLAASWMEESVAYAETSKKALDPKILEDEMNRFMKDYEKTEMCKRSKTG